MHATQDKNRISNELSDLRDQVDIKDRKINVLQRKVCVALINQLSVKGRLALTGNVHFGGG